jgi:ketosteroid isomerase-like protein
MENIEAEIREIVNRETTAWDQLDAEVLVSLFHPDMIWPWPPNSQTHDPAHWIFPLGRFNRDRWKKSWLKLFETHELIHNRRKIIRVEVSVEGDGAFAVVDVDTLWRNRATGEDFHWKGRACKGYSKCNGEWLLIMHLGLLDYGRS